MISSPFVHQHKALARKYQSLGAAQFQFIEDMRELPMHLAIVQIVETQEVARFVSKMARRHLSAAIDNKEREHVAQAANQE